MLGSTGNRADPGKVFKGKKMPGHLGVEKKTIDCLKVIKRKNNTIRSIKLMPIGRSSM